jgi:transcriptional regulator with XRE-family HTH domain
MNGSCTQPRNLLYCDCEEVNIGFRAPTIHSRRADTMAWERTPKGRSCPCNGDLVKQRRLRRRWTQENLADITGFSVRLIAKAEAGGSLHPDTIEVLAAALSTATDPLFPEDLIADPKQLALEFLKQLKLHQGQVVSKCHQFLAEEVRFVMPGNPDILPFAGRHVGVDAMDQACFKFFEAMEIPKLELWRTEFVVCEGNEVVTGQWIPGQVRGLAQKGFMVATPALIVNRIVFARGKIVTYDDYFLHHEAEQAFLEQKQLLHSTAAS